MKTSAKNFGLAVGS